jgi:steroid delta-isomerase-like uncharacterized protein
MTQQAPDRTVPAEALIRGTFPTLVPAPAFFALAHFSYRPGAFFPPAKGNGPVVFRVLEGTLEFEAQDVATKTPAGGQPRDMTPGEHFTVTVGDQLVMPGDVLHSARTVGETPARILGLAVFGAAPAQEFPPGIAFEPLVLGPVSIVPAAPADATVTRLSPPADATVRVGGAGPRIVRVESGTVRVLPGTGDVAYWRGTGPFAPPSVLEPGGPVELSGGDGLLLQAGATLTLQGAGDGTAVVVASVQATEPGRDESHPDEVVRGYFREVVDAGAPEAVTAWVAPYGYHHDRPENEQGTEGLAAALRAELDALSGAATTVDDAFGAEDVVLHRWTRTARHTGTFHSVPATWQPVTARGLTISRVRGDRIVEDWEVQDVTEQIRQVAGRPPVGDLDAGAGPGGTTATRAAAARYVYDLWHSGREAVADDLLAPGYTNHTRLPGQQPGAAGVRQFVRRWHTAFPDVSVTVDLLVADGERAAVRWTSRGHHLGPILGLAPSGRYVTVSGITVLAVRDGRITDSWQQWAVLSLLDQAGPAPAPPEAVPQPG